MKATRGHEIAALGLVGAVLMAMAPSAMAASTWDLSGTCTNCAAVTMTGKSGWSATGSGSGATFAATVAPVSYSGGYGVSSASDPGGSPEHSIDNFGSTDAILLSFSSSVILRQILIGWAAWDSDVSVLRYTGSGAPSLAGKSIALALTSGWVSVGNYNAVASPTQADAGGNNATATAINTAGASSSWWLISAFNSSYGGTGTGVGGGSGSAYSGGYDFVKLLQVGGDKALSVPEPGSLALVAAALLGGFATRRRTPPA